MSTSILLFIYVMLLLLGIFVLVILSELRHRRFRAPRSVDRVFRCENCGAVYTDDPDVDRSRCSQCGTSNDAIQY
jgi:DNA-directed RNA polymerase subunit RPC12/RpoP